MKDGASSRPTSDKDDAKTGSPQPPIRFIVAAIVVSSCVILAIRTLKGQQPTESYCNSPDCLRHAEILTAALNRSLDPCHDFQAYVCSAWKPPTGYLQNSHSAMEDLLKSWFPAFHDILLRGHRILEVARKPLAMYEYCMGDHSKYGSNAMRFGDILTKLGLSWPDINQSHQNISAFYVLFTLKFKWNVPLLFDVKVLRLNYTPRWRFTVVPSSLIPVELKHQRSVARSNRYKYWRSFYDILPDNASQPPISDSDIDAIINTEAEILSNLSASMARQAAQPLLVKLAQIGVYTPSITSNEWLSALRQVKFDPDVSSDDQVLLTDKGFYRTFGRMLQKYTNEQLLMFIAWSFVQLYAPTADYRLLTARYGDDDALKLYRPFFCARFVESAYGLLVLVVSSLSRFRPDERAFVNAGFNNLVQTAAIKVNESIWLDVQSRRTAATKISSAVLHLWPPDRYLNNDELDRLYNSFPSNATSFFEHWVASTESLTAVSQSQVDADVLDYPVNYALPYLRFDRPTGTLNVAVGAVTHPLYYGNGTSAMFYGGLGFSMALQLVKSLDPYGLQWHPNGTFGGSIFNR
ncbi:hypothetical protein HPB48_010606 [Haemaphysalis longicornis]|uniref:Peptidase M13 N-terminal domain-containing protein n=1 Tax=Haemaphysalis longicornis TaxID=44386 RepID=A0A9J6GHT8_HAELO|nr:hypothetical protein HPB48_010606 [Haemaphysalis longicornis]